MFGAVCVTVVGSLSLWSMVQLLDVSRWFAPVNLGQPHLGIHLALLVQMSMLALVLWRSAHYSRPLAFVGFIMAIMSAILAFCFSMPMPGVWLLVCLVMWRLCGVFPSRAV